VLVDYLLQSRAGGHSLLDVPRFGQFRLAFHLGGNYMAYAIFLWTGLSHLLVPLLDHTKVPRIGQFRTSLQVTAFFLFTTILIGS
jgi:hypothetical protein